MPLIEISLEKPIQQFVSHQSQVRNLSQQQLILELLNLGFETMLHQAYQRYQHGDISFGGLAKELGITTWELSHLLEERSWSVSNLPA